MHTYVKMLTEHFARSDNSFFRCDLCKIALLSVMSGQQSMMYVRYFCAISNWHQATRWYVCLCCGVNSYVLTSVWVERWLINKTRIWFDCEIEYQSNSTVKSHSTSVIKSRCDNFKINIQMASFNWLISNFCKTSCSISCHECFCATLGVYRKKLFASDKKKKENWKIELNYFAERAASSIIVSGPMKWSLGSFCRNGVQIWLVQQRHR
jgi:hypothetical protein